MDFSGHSRTRLATAADLAAKFGSQLLLGSRGAGDAEAAHASAFFHEARIRAGAAQGCGAHLASWLEDMPERELGPCGQSGLRMMSGMEILRIAEHKGADLIVIATHGMTGWHQLAFGSVAEKVVRLAILPRARAASESQGRANRPPDADPARYRCRIVRAMRRKHLGTALGRSPQAIEQREQNDGNGGTDNRGK